MKGRVTFGLLLVKFTTKSHPTKLETIFLNVYFNISSILSRVIAGVKSHSQERRPDHALVGEGGHPIMGIIPKYPPNWQFAGSSAVR
jgi:hypothetical protein